MKDENYPVLWTDFKTVGELREFLSNPSLHDNDLTNVNQLEIKPDLIRVVMHTSSDE